MTALTLHPDRLFSSDPAQRDLARPLRNGRGSADRQPAWAYRPTVVFTEHKIEEDEAFELAPELAYKLAKRAYKL